MTEPLPVADGYNAPSRGLPLEASFADLANAQAYAEKYGGEIEHRGVAFVVVGDDADHDAAIDDLRTAQAAPVGEAPAVASDLDERIAAAIERERDKLRAEFDAEREAWLAEHPEPAADPEPAPDAKPAK